ncbi:MAG: NAD(P)H-dependent glycerol-3-phosphate dehydrogenase [Pseudomonadota bacterium]
MSHQTRNPSIGIIGGGAWGTALAQVMASDGSDVLLWAHESEVVAAINYDHANPAFLPGITLSPGIAATTALADLDTCSLILAVAPAQHLAALLGQLSGHGQPIILCSKGMEQSTGRLMCEVAVDAGWSGPVAVLSGPTFAHEVGAGLPAAVTLACADEGVAEQLAKRIARPMLRPYASTDVIGAEIGGVVKNVLAIACGVVDGAGLGQNARAALISRGFAEMMRYGLARGARMETLAGLAGLGDLVLTCSSTSSRNFSLGHGLGKGRAAPALLADRATVAEGAYSAAILVSDAARRGVDMPICAAVADLIAANISAKEAITALLSRPLKREGWASLD